MALGAPSLTIPPHSGMLSPAICPAFLAPSGGLTPGACHYLLVFRVEEGGGVQFGAGYSPPCPTPP